MSGVRRLLLDDSPGERRGVVLLDGAPERLLIERDGEYCPLQPGGRYVGRVRRLEPGLGLAFLDLGDGEAVLPLSKGLHEGRAVEVEIAAPGRQGKRAKAKMLGQAEGEPRPIEPPPSLAARLQAFAPEATIEGGDRAAEAAEAAQDAVLAREHALGGGASLSLEETRGLVAVDVDVGGAAGSDARASQARVNRQALSVGARLLRLKGLGGLIVFDLAGKGQGGETLLQAAREAFAPDMPGVVFGPVSRLGVLHLAVPWRSAPTAQQLLDDAGRLSPRTVAQQVARTVLREARGAVRVEARCAPDVAAAAEAIRAALLARIGPRFDIRPDPVMDRETFDVRPA